MTDDDSRATPEDLKRTARILLVLRMNVPLLTLIFLNKINNGSASMWLMIYLS